MAVYLWDTDSYDKTAAFDWFVMRTDSLIGYKTLKVINTYITEAVSLILGMLHEMAN